MTKSEKLLIAGLEEARKDMAFIRVYTKDAAMRRLLDAAIDVAGRYLQEGILGAFEAHLEGNK